MINKIIEYCIKNRFLVLLVTSILVAWGVFALARTPIDAIPDLSENQVIVFTDWEGRSPKEVEDQITYPLSVNLQGLAGIKAIRSFSDFGFSMINIIFEDKIDFYFARTRVLERLSIASSFLPPGVVPYLAPDATALGQIFWYTVEGEGYDLAELRAIQDWFIRYQLYVKGVAQVASAGGFVREYQIDVDPNRLLAHKINLGDVFMAVSRSNTSVGGKVIQKHGTEYLIRGFGWIEKLKDIEDVVVGEENGIPIYVRNVGQVQVGPAFRRSVLEKNGAEAVGGVVLMKYGENPLEVTERVKERIKELQKGLPKGVRIVPFYERTGLIHRAISTLTETLVEEIIVTTLVVLVCLFHFRSAVVICSTLPLAVLVSFLIMYYFKIPSNIMSLSGIAISIGVLVDAGIVMTENVFRHLTDHFGKNRVKGDIREHVLKPSLLVGRPIFFSVMIMLLSFLPIFALRGMEGKMFHPLVFTKTFALMGVSIIAITLVPVLCTFFVKGRLRSEEENPIVRGFVHAYKPLLEGAIRHKKFTIWMAVVLIAFAVTLIPKMGREFMPPLDEGSIMDMPITVPSASTTQASNDLILRGDILRSFPEVEMVVGKAGRADTPTDPAPVGMVETIVTLRDKELWPRRKLTFDFVKDEVGRLIQIYQEKGFLKKDISPELLSSFSNEMTMGTLSSFDRAMRRIATTRLRECASGAKEANLKVDQKLIKRINWELDDWAAPTLITSIAESLVKSAQGQGLLLKEPALEELTKIRQEEGPQLAPKIYLRIKSKNDLVKEMDSELQVPGWGNIWTQPIINRVDMLATGVRTMIGVKIFGSDLDELQRLARETAAVLKDIRGAVDVFPDQIVGENYLEIIPKRDQAARYGINVGDILDVVEVALGGKTITNTVEGRRRFPVRVRYARAFREEIDKIRRVLLTTKSGAQIPFSLVIDIVVAQGPTMIKSENGLLTVYVQLNVRDRDIVSFVEEARQAVDEKVKMPSGYYVQWSGQFENQVRARKTLQMIVPLVLVLIFVILYMTYNSIIDAVLMLLAIPGALAGGVIFQYILGYNFSVAVWVGYLVCFGIAAETGIVMLVFLKEALEKRGGLEKIQSVSQITEAMIEGAALRLRPKLLTIATTIIGLVPMLWATGTGAEVMRPLAAPVLGGVITSDLLILIVLPVLYHWVMEVKFKRRSSVVGHQSSV